MKKLSLFPYRAYGRVRDIGTLVMKDKATVESAQSEHKGDFPRGQRGRIPEERHQHRLGFIQLKEGNHKR